MAGAAKKLDNAATVVDVTKDVQNYINEHLVRLNNRDLEGLYNTYAEGGLRLEFDGQVNVGKKALQDHWREVFKSLDTGIHVEIKIQQARAMGYVTWGNGDIHWFKKMDGGKKGPMIRHMRLALVLSNETGEYKYRMVSVAEVKNNK